MLGIYNSSSKYVHKLRGSLLIMSIHSRLLRIAGSVLAIASFINVPISSASAKQDNKIHVAYYVGKGVGKPPNLRRKLKEQADMQVTFMEGGDLRDGDLRGYDILIVPGGLSKIEARSMEKLGRQEVRRFVKEGGAYIGICAGCYLASSSSETDLRLLPMQVLDSKHWHRGRANLNVELTDDGMQIFGRDKPHINVVYHNGPVLGWKNGVPDDRVIVLGRYLNEVVAPGGKRGIMQGAPSMVYSQYGAGRVIGCSPHPEKSPGLENMIPHAIRWLVKQQRQDVRSNKNF